MSPSCGSGHRSTSQVRLALGTGAAEVSRAGTGKRAEQAPQVPSSAVNPGALIHPGLVTLPHALPGAQALALPGWAAGTIDLGVPAELSSCSSHGQQLYPSPQAGPRSQVPATSGHATVNTISFIFPNVLSLIPHNNPDR